MGWRALLLVFVVGCEVELGPFEREKRNLAESDAGPSDGGLRDGEMEPIVAQEWCWRWICEGHRGEVVRRSCGGLDEYDCR